MNIVVIYFKSFIFIHTGCNRDQNIFIKRTTVSKTFSPKHALLLKLKNKVLELSRISPIMNHPDVIKLIHVIYKLDNILMVTYQLGYRQKRC